MNDKTKITMPVSDLVRMAQHYANGEIQHELDHGHSEDFQPAPKKERDARIAKKVRADFKKMEKKASAEKAKRQPEDNPFFPLQVLPVNQ